MTHCRGHRGDADCLVEDEDESPWTPVAQERGVPTGRSAVNVLACAAPRQVMRETNARPLVHALP
jgi:hypothetical protein